MKAGVIGAGAWGTALGITAARGGADVVIWSYDGKCKQFEGIATPANMRITSCMADLRETDAWLIVTPAAYFRETLRDARQHYAGQPVIICTKGADPQTGEFMSEILKTEMPQCSEFGVLSGPQFAAEVARGVPTGSTLAGTAAARRAGHEILNKLFLSDSEDVIGAELCGVGKNAVALICGYNSVASAGENERAMIFTRAWNEVVNIGMRIGADARTFLELCGIGDLFLSATSTTSRNFAGGIAIAQNQPPVGTVEGIFALRGLVKRAAALGIETPVLAQMQEKMKI